jgi:hypothetical protein
MSTKKTKKSLPPLKKVNMNLKRTSYLFKEFFITSTKYKTLSFLRRDVKGWLLMNKLMEHYYAQKELHVEELVTMIPSKVCSRATLLSYITGCEIKKVLTKTSSPHDKRIKIVKPTPEFVDEFERWSEEFYSDDNWEMKTDYKKL